MLILFGSKLRPTKVKLAIAYFDYWIAIACLRHATQTPTPRANAPSEFTYMLDCDHKP
ncbi:hypothetical protein [Nostoc sp.]